MFAAITRVLRLGHHRQAAIRARRRPVRGGRRHPGYRFSPMFYVALVVGVVSSVSFFGVLISVMAGG